MFELLLKNILIGVLGLNILTPIITFINPEQYDIGKYVKHIGKGVFYQVWDVVLYPKTKDPISLHLFTENEIRDYLSTSPEIRYKNMMIVSFPQILIELINKIDYNEFTQYDKEKLTKFIRSWKIENWVYVLYKYKLGFDYFKYNNLFKQLWELYPKSILDIR